MNYSLGVRITLKSLFPTMAETYGQVFSAEDYPALNSHLQRMTTISRVFSLSIISSLAALSFLHYNKNLSNTLTNRIKAALIIGVIFDLAIIFISTALLKIALKSDAEEIKKQYPEAADQERYVREREGRTNIRYQQVMQSFTLLNK